jgi:hypothetical protein
MPADMLVIDKDSVVPCSPAAWTSQPSTIPCDR